MNYTHLGALLIVLAACSDVTVPTDSPKFAITPIPTGSGTFTNADDGTNSYTEYSGSNADRQNGQVVVYLPGGGGLAYGIESQISRELLYRLPVKLPKARIFAPRYRVGYVWPDQENDVRCFIAYLRYNAATLGIDKNKIAVIGHSFGGFLAYRLGRDNEPALTCYQGTSTTPWQVIGIAGPSRVDELTTQYFNYDASQFLAELFGYDVAARVSFSPALSGGACVIRGAIFHGMKDTSVKVIHADEMKLACPSWLLTKYADGTHGMMGNSYKFLMINSIVTLLTTP